MDHEIKLSSLAEIGTVTDMPEPTTRPTAFAVMCLSGVQRPTFYEILTASDFRAELDRLGLRARSVCTTASLRRAVLKELCLDYEPTREGLPKTTLLSEADVVCWGVDESNAGTVVS